jgi:hypothetical protein
MSRREHACHRCRKLMANSQYSCCRPCRALERARVKAAADAAREAGLCSICRKMEQEPGYNTCAGCQERSQRLCSEAYKNAVASRICIRCRRREPNEGNVTCERCLKKRRNEWAKLQKARRGERLRDGMKRILEALRDQGSLTLQELAVAAGMSTRTVLRHARKLEPRGLLFTELDGHRKVYSLGQGCRWSLEQEAA